MLLHHANAARDGVSRRLQRHGLLIDGHRPRVGLLETVRDSHERRFSGAVLAEQRVHCSTCRAERRVVECEDRPEPLDDRPERERRIGHSPVGASTNTHGTSNAFPTCSAKAWTPSVSVA